MISRNVSVAGSLALAVATLLAICALFVSTPGYAQMMPADCRIFSNAPDMPEGQRKVLEQNPGSLVQICRSVWTDGKVAWLMSPITVSDRGVCRFTVQELARERADPMDRSMAGWSVSGTPPFTYVAQSSSCPARDAKLYVLIWDVSERDFIRLTAFMARIAESRQALRIVLADDLLAELTLAPIRSAHLTNALALYKNADPSVRIISMQRDRNFTTKAFHIAFVSPGSNLTLQLVDHGDTFRIFGFGGWID